MLPILLIHGDGLLVSSNMFRSAIARVLGGTLVATLTSVGPVRAQSPPVAPGEAQVAPGDSSRPFEIEDNSFFVEEAFNQEAGVVQEIFGAAFLQDAGGWAATFTQEWPAPGVRHQLSYTILLTHLNGADGIGDVAINYRYQLLTEGPGRPAFAPRLTLLCPTGSEARGFGAGAWGLQTNLPASKQRGDFYLHGNVGLTWYPRARSGIARSASPLQADPVALVSPFVAGSAIYRLRPMLNLMLESVATWQDAVVAPGRTSRTALTIVSPGVRGGWNRGRAQIILGAALPVTLTAGSADVGVFTYFSYEAPMWKVRTP
jgi:hypothetical protein